MKPEILEREQIIPASIADVFAPFADAGNLQAITPPWLHFRIISTLPIEMKEGAEISYRLRLHAIPVRWRTRIMVWEPPFRFVDQQESGPFALWRHTHIFEAVEGGTLARDRVEYKIGFGPAGALAHRLFVRNDLERIFDYRQAAILEMIPTSDASGPDLLLP